MNNNCRSIQRKHFIWACFFLTISLELIGCFGGKRWSEKERHEFAQKCSLTDTVSGLTFEITGFKYNEIKNIKVRQVHNASIIDSFYLHTPNTSFDSLNPSYTVSIDRPLYIKDSYQFILNPYSLYILSDMKMVMWAQFTMFSEGYGCVMGEYKIDGKKFEHNANPNFIKKGFAYH